MEIKLKTKSVKDYDLPLDFIPIVAAIRRKRFSTTRHLIKKMECFGWHFNNFADSYESTTVTVYGNTATAKDNYSHYLKFVRPDVFMGNAFLRMFEWLYMKLLWLYIACRWAWVPAIILGSVLCGMEKVSIGLVFILVPICFVILYNILGFIAKLCCKKTMNFTLYCLDTEGYEMEWGMTEKQFREVAKKI